MFVAMFFLSNCGKQELFKNITWEGHVFDTIGGKPVSGFYLQLNACTFQNGAQCSGGVINLKLEVLQLILKGILKYPGVPQGQIVIFLRQI